MKTAEAYVYVVFDGNGIPRYVGKGRGKRWRSYRTRSHNPFLTEIIKKYGADLPIVRVREGLTDEQAFAVEIAFIKAIGRGKDGPLVNLTDGGDGVTRHSDEAKAKLRAFRIGKKLPKWVRENMRRGHLGTKHSPEHRAAIGAAHKGKKISAAHRDILKMVDHSYCAGPITDKRREGIRSGMLAFWAQRRQNGLPLRHARAR